MANAENEIRAAIKQSIIEDRRVEISASVEAVAAVAEAMGYETDTADENDGTVDMWGWTDETEENEQDWRLSLRADVEEDRDAE